MVVVVTGVMAAGKSTVADLLARRFDRGVHVRGDLFRRMVVSGRAEYTEKPSSEALEQWRLRQLLAAEVANTYAAAGFDVVVQDIFMGDTLRPVLDVLIPRPRHLVVLEPDVETVAAREAARPKTGYVGGLTVESHHAEFYGTTPRLGLWLDNSKQTPDETIAAILSRMDEARID